MQTQRATPDPHRLQRAIERIDGVSSAKVAVGDGGEIEEIHLVSSRARRPKQIVRDTESLLYARFGIRVDYRRISLVQMDADDGSVAQGRLRLTSVQPVPDGSALRSVLQYEGEFVEGHAPIRSQTQEPPVQEAAQATLAAVEEAASHVVELQLQELQQVEADGRRVCLVVVQARTPVGQERLTGTAVIGSDPLVAAAKASLDALNRRLTVWMSTYGLGQQAASSEGPARTV